MPSGHDYPAAYYFFAVVVMWGIPGYRMNVKSSGAVLDMMVAISPLLQAATIFSSTMLNSAMRASAYCRTCGI